MIELPKGLHKRISEALEIWDIEDLYPPQKEAFPIIASGKNMVVCVPTASGKSLIAYVAMLNKVLRGGKALYIVPLRALASEKFSELKALRRMGLKIALSYGDYDSEDANLERNDIVIATSEKADSLLRNRAGWLSRLGVIVADEVHLMNDAGRGPTLEVILTRFKQLDPPPQIVCLSATVGNADEVSAWLDAKLVDSDFRPVKLVEGVLEGNIVTDSNLTTRNIPIVTGDPIMDLILETVEKDNAQVLTFVNTRKGCETAAANAALTVHRLIDKKDRERLKDVIMKLGSGESRMLKRLRSALEGGCAFHHAGLSNEQRGLVEGAFRSKAIKALYATPTLAAGINLPARRVVVRDWTRYETYNPRSPIPVLEVKQMLGRAGRPRYDKEGEGLVLARDPDEAMELMERYIWGKNESIYSKLGSMPALRTHLLSSFSTGHVKDRKGMWEFISSTFYAHQNDTWKLEGDVEETLVFLAEEEFIEIDGERIIPTDLGKRVARLYIDPLSAVVLKKALKRPAMEMTAFSILQVISSTTDVPSLYLRAKDYDPLSKFLEERRDQLMMDVPMDQVDKEWFLSSVKTAMFFMEWIGENGSEASEEKMEELFNMGPGDIRSRVETAVWMLYAMRELSRLLNTGFSSYIDMISLRVEHGIREELLPLVKLKGIGRVRARKLFQAGYRSLDSINRATIDEIAKVGGIGRTLAASIKSAAGPDMSMIEEEPEPEIDPQSSLADF